MPFDVLREAGFDNLSLDLIYGIPGQSAADLERDLAEALALEPEHVSAYELEAKPGTRFTHAHGAELERQAESMESYFELVVETLTAAGYRWYETANFCRTPERAHGRDLRARHNLGYWLGAGLPRSRRGRGQHNREPALEERAVDPRLRGGARGGRATAARARGALAGDARDGARDAGPAPRRAGRARRAGAHARRGRARAAAAARARRAPRRRAHADVARPLHRRRGHAPRCSSDGRPLAVRARARAAEPLAHSPTMAG